MDALAPFRQSRTHGPSSAVTYYAYSADYSIVKVRAVLLQLRNDQKD
jgi:hypothetical protein